MAREKGIPLDLMQGNHIAAYSRFFGGQHAALALQSAYTSSPENGAPSRCRTLFDRNANEKLISSMNNFNYAREMPHFWTEAARAHGELASTFFGPEGAKYFELVNRVEGAPIDPHDLAKLLMRNDSSLKIQHQARLLSLSTGILIKASETAQAPTLRHICEKLDGTFDLKYCIGKYAEQEHAHLISWHNPTSLRTTRTCFNESSCGNAGDVMRSQLLPVRCLNDKSTLFYTGKHTKPAASILGKTIEKSLKSGSSVVNPAITVSDFHGLIFVPMHSENYASLKSQVLKHARDIFPEYQFEDDNVPSRGLSGEGISFDRVNIIPDPRKRNRYVEVMFQLPSEFIDAMLFTGEDGKGCARPVYQIERGIRTINKPDGTTTSLVDFLFPKSIYGVDPRALAQEHLQHTIQRLKAGY